MRTLASFLLGTFLVGYTTNLLGQDLSAFVVDVSDMADGTVSQARLEAQRQAASGGLPFRSFRKGEYRKFVGQITPPELPEDKKDRFVYGLALFSDDGCTLTLNGSYIISRLGRGQHLPNLGESFHELPVVLTPGKSVEVVLDYMNTIYFVDPKRPIPDIDGFTIFLFLIPVEMVADYNRDGAIDDKDRGRVSEQQPFRWWLNDDDDNGDLSHEDTPLGIASSQADASLGNNQVDGSCDLIDWFPLFLDIKHLINVLPPSQHEYYLKHENAALNLVYTDLKPEGAGEYPSKWRDSRRPEERTIICNFCQRRNTNCDGVSEQDRERRKRSHLARRWQRHQQAALFAGIQERTRARRDTILAEDRRCRKNVPLDQRAIKCGRR